MGSLPVSAPTPLRAYVSASTRGLAYEIAAQLARQGAEVALSGREEERLEAARSAIRRDAPAARVITVVADLSTPEGQGRVLSSLQADRFAPDVFVCSAGQPGDASLSSLTREQWDHDVEMVLGQAVFGVKHFAPSMADRGFGRVIFVSSTYAKAPTRQFVTSSIARAGLFALSKAVVDEFGHRDVASFVLCLGFVDTPLLRNMALGRGLEAEPPPEPPSSWLPKYEEWAADIPARRIGTTSELAQVVEFLVSPAAAYLTGTVLSYAGGMDRSLV